MCLDSSLAPEALWSRSAPRRSQIDWTLSLGSVNPQRRQPGKEGPWKGKMKVRSTDLPPTPPPGLPNKSPPRTPVPSSGRENYRHVRSGLPCGVTAMPLKGLGKQPRVINIVERSRHRDPISTVRIAHSSSNFEENEQADKKMQNYMIMTWILLVFLSTYAQNMCSQRLQMHSFG